MKSKKPPEWMKKGVLVEFTPEFFPYQGFRRGEKFTGRLESDPFPMPSGDWKVRIGDMDERYQELTGRNVHTLASVIHVSQVRR